MDNICTTKWRSFKDSKSLLASQSPKPSFYRPFASHWRERRMYDTRGAHFNLLQEANNIYTTVRECCSYAQERMMFIHNQKMQLLNAPGSLVSVTIGIIGPIPGTADGAHNVLIMIYHYYEIIYAIPALKTTTPPITKIVFGLWVILPVV